MKMIVDVSRGMSRPIHKIVHKDENYFHEDYVKELKRLIQEAKIFAQTQLDYIDDEEDIEFVEDWLERAE